MDTTANGAPLPRRSSVCQAHEQVAAAIERAIDLAIEGVIDWDRAGPAIAYAAEALEAITDAIRDLEETCRLTAGMVGAIYGDGHASGVREGLDAGFRAGWEACLAALPDGQSPVPRPRGEHLRAV